MSITAKQARFAAEYVVDGNGTAAAIRAGFNPNSARVTACRLLKGNTGVQAALEAHRAALAARMDLTRQDVIDGLLEAIQTAGVQQDPAAMIRGWAEIGKVCGFYAPTKHAVAVETIYPETAVLERRLNSMSDAELVRLIETGENVGEASESLVPSG